MIELDHVTRTYGRKVAVNDVSLAIQPGELFAFLGPNGAGKTTTIRVLVGLLRPSRGTVRICGHDLSNAGREARRCLGYVPDEPYLYDKLSGREFLEFIAGLYGMPRDVAESCIEREIARFDLGEFVGELAENYSHGMKQRLVFASAMLHDPRVLVIDEPMVGLDPRTARLVKDLLRDRAASGVTIFMSTHSLDVAEEIATRIGIVDHGRLLRLGTLEQLRRQSEHEHRSLEAMFLEVTDSAADGTRAGGSPSDHGSRAEPGAELAPESDDLPNAADQSPRRG